MTKITQNFYQTKGKRTIMGFLSLFVLLLMGAQMSWGQQVIGSFPSMDGGFEGQTGTLGTTLSNTAWSVSTSGNGIVGSSFVRTGLKSVNFYTTSTAKRLQSPTTATNAVSNVQYTVQYYYRTATATATAASMQIGASPNGTSSPTYFPSGAPYTILASSNPGWTKYSAQVTVATAPNGNAGIGIIRCNTPTMGVALDIDDFVMYPGTTDVTVPDAPTAPSIPTPLATQMNVTWTAAAVGAGNGVDGGGYMVVRGIVDPTTPPNVNGIYAVGNTVAAGEQVVYLGAANSFNDTGLTPSTTYYYRIYSVDKAFNYSAPITVNATTTAPNYASEPTIQASGASFSGVTSTGFTVNFTAGDGTNNLVVIKSGSAVNSDPGDGNTYTANTVFGSGTQLGTGNYVVYSGTGNSVSVTGLSKATTYYVKVYSFNGTTGSENYLIPNPASGNQITSPGEIVSTGLNSAGVTWATASAWVGGVVPGATDNVTIAAGDKIQLAAAASCYNLTINSTGKLYNNANVVGGSMNYLTVNGTSATINGTLGDKDDTAAYDCALGLYFNGNLTISGSGIIRPGRLRPNTNTQNATLTIDADMEMTYKGSTGTGGASIYTDSSSNDNITITINSGKTLSFVGLSNLNTASSSATNGNASTTINVNGTLTLPTGSNLSLPIASGKTCVLNVNGTLNVDKLNATSSVGGSAPTITVGPSGVINVSNTADFSSATLSAAVTGSGAFNLLSGAVINIGTAIGLDPVAGPIRTTTRNFNTGANYSYVGSAAQVPGSDLPATVNNFTVNNPSGVTMGADLTTNFVTITAGTLTVPSGKNLTITNALVNSGTLTLENNANLIQTATTNTNSGSGNVVVKRNSSALSRLDYTLWSSPVANQNLLAFSPATATTRFYNFNTTYNVGSVNGAFSAIADPSLTPFSVGSGYLIRMPNTAVEAPAAETFNGQFTGLPNNGDVPVPLVDGAAAGLRYNLVGNPYPSPISIGTFVTNNTANIETTLYFWRKTNGAGSAYCTYNTAGVPMFTTNGNAQSVDPAGVIQIGQGFFVEAKSGATSLTFKNGQRVANNANQFFKTKQLAAPSRLWLNATTTAGAFSQMAVNYADGATPGVDDYDSKYINDSAFALTSSINNGEYTIQGRPVFDASDVVPLNFKTNLAGDYTIAIDHSEGVFATGQEVYLVDSKTGTETKLKDGAYTFTAAAGVDNARFSLKYQKTLKVNEAAFNDNNVTVYKNNGRLQVSSSAKAINSVRVYDVQGRLIAEQKNVKANTATFSNLKVNNQVLIVKVTGEDNSEVTKKVLN
ncbi:T9SS sorting signal type C domain-containing protein [Flavobacterium nackdongense]|uniref:T9SS sorting signal type C domain-containing protein n=1 Tax=Flavobacterium nackdongense TaxID=2547394 RepID=A0A4P6Y968_9FLAO|nr:T9SS sorting signal type C domain-containing protein [Flavobacterium nackdongense]QBN19531.1 T9SS sorting signal type C domain-containing protein [Flavobacterium nackdongense]